MVLVIGIILTTILFFRGKDMAIREKRFKCGRYLEVEIYPISRFEQSKSRGRKKKESRKEQKNLNEKNTRKNLRRRIHANFDNGDLFLTLSYNEEFLPENEEGAIRDRNNFIRRVKNYRKKHGLSEVKYISVLEYREASEDKRTSTRIHHHLVISGMDRDVLEGLWGRGRANASRLQEGDFGFEELSNYLSKDPKGRKRWSGSRNLVIPEGVINDFKYSKRKVYDLARSQGEDFESLYPGFICCGFEVRVNEVDGGVYLSLRMREKRILKK